MLVLLAVAKPFDSQGCILTELSGCMLLIRQPLFEWFISKYLEDTISLSLAYDFRYNS